MRSLAIAVALVLGATTPDPAQAVEYRIQAQTVGDAYQLVTSANRILNRRRLHQYVGFGAHDLLSDGGHQLSLTTLFRFDVDFGVSEQELDDVRSLRREQLSLQFATLEGRDIAGFIDFTLGRQVIADAMDFMMLDGATVRFDTPWYVSVELLGGLEVKPEQFALNASMYELDGVRVVEGVETNDKTTVAVGVALMTHGLKDTRVRIGYRRLFSAGQVDQEKVGGTLNQRLLKVLHVNATASYDFFNARFDRIQAGARWQVTDFFDLEGEYVRLLPSFDADSIFNIFTAFPMNDANARMRFRPSADDRLYVGGMVRFFGNEGYTDGFLLDETDTIVQAYGAMAGYSHRFGAHGRVRLDGSWEAGYGGDRILADLAGKWAIIPGEWELDGRVTAVVFADEQQPNLAATSIGYQVGVRYLIDRRAAIQVMAEHNFNKLQTQQLRVFAVADLNFWL